MTISGIHASFPSIPPRGIEGITTPAPAPASPSRSAANAPRVDGLQQVLTAEERAFFLGAGPVSASALYDATGQTGQAIPVAGLRLDVRA